MKLSLTWERFTKITALLSGIIIFLGFTSLFIYYKYFDIDIFQFLNISEVVSTSFSFLLRLFLPIVLSFLIITVIFKFSWVYRPNKKVSSLYFVVFIMLFMFAGPLAQLTNFDNNLLNEVFTIFKMTIYLSSAFLSLFYSWYIDSIPIKDYHSVDRTKIITLKSTTWIAVPIIIIHFTIVQWSKINNVKNEHSTSTSVFYLSNDSIITSNDSIKYLGKTEGYYFLWNKNSKTSTIYPASEIKKIDIKP